MTLLRIHPSIGIARIGNSHRFYIAPEEIGALPLACDEAGDPPDTGKAPYVSRFKDSKGQIIRQAARFKVFEHDLAGHSIEIDLNGPNISSVEWSVHLANKKSAWYRFQEPEDYKELQANGYSYPDVTEKPAMLRNNRVVGDRARQLITDPGPRTLTQEHTYRDFDVNHVGDYKFASFPASAPKEGTPVTSLGTIRLDRHRNLLVVGGSGSAGGSQPFSSFTGADGWFDDISDGPVRCTIKFKSGDVKRVYAWVIVAPPAYAPEIVNAVTLDDILFDVACRSQNLNSAIKSGAHGWNEDYEVDFNRDVKPVLDRFARYRWVANVPYMAAFSAPGTDPAYNARTPDAETLRQSYFKIFRRPRGFDSRAGQEDAFETAGGYPLMPLGAGNNPLTSRQSAKFLALTPTQYFYLRQWANGKFTVGGSAAVDPIHPLDRASVGNCVGAPVSPGYEVTWSMHNPFLYDGPYSIKHRSPDGQLYDAQGLTYDYDETKSATGCEPGDLTKRMSAPWHADFVACGTQMIAFKDTQGARGPMFMASWWPPQVPETVIAGKSAAKTSPDHTYGSSGSFLPLSAEQPDAILKIWTHLGFIVNQLKGSEREWYPFYAESERDNAKLQDLIPPKPPK